MKNFEKNIVLQTLNSLKEPYWQRPVAIYGIF